ncbi:MAG: hypothetical protein HY075_12240, partial [Deltaproteobacteria bacterium]|nr:hypothetical protein [Deltaproteobacteria bacterium]
HGFVEPARLRARLAASPHVFVSPSLGGAANPGSASLGLLAPGSAAVLSAWGSNLDLAERFPDRVLLVPVRGGPAGPFVSPEELAHTLREALARPASRKAVSARPPSRALAEAAARLEALLGQPASRRKQPLVSIWALPPERSDWSRSIPSTQRPNDYFSDPISAFFFRAYGMQLIPESWNESKGGYWVPPWVKIASDAVVVRDPHRGRHFLPFMSRGTVRVQDFFGGEHTLPEKTVKELVQSGYAFPGSLP